MAAVSAASGAGFKLDNIALDPDLLLGESEWVSQKGIFDQKPSTDFRETIRTAGFDLLQKAGEPKHTLSIYSAGMSKLANNGFPPEDQDPDKYFPKLVKDFEDNIAYRQGFLHFPQPENWWHQELTLSHKPQSDQVEQKIVELLVKSKGPVNEQDIFQHMYHEFPALDTPQEGLILACLDSYAEIQRAQTTSWQLKQNEVPASRIQAMEDIETKLREMGTGLGFFCKQQGCTREDDLPGDGKREFNKH